MTKMLCTFALAGALFLLGGSLQESKAQVWGGYYHGGFGGACAPSFGFTYNTGWGGGFYRGGGCAPVVAPRVFHRPVRRHFVRPRPFIGRRFCW